MLDNVEKDCLEVEENGDCLFWDVVDVVELFDTVSLDVIGSVNWKAFVVMGDICLLLRYEV